MNAQHTKGPLEYDATLEEIGRTIDVGGDPCWLPVCTMCSPTLYHTPDSDLEMEANAALIVAAFNRAPACRPPHTGLD